MWVLISYLQVEIHLFIWVNAADIFLIMALIKVFDESCLPYLIVPQDIAYSWDDYFAHDLSFLESPDLHLRLTRPAKNNHSVLS